MVALCFHKKGKEKREMKKLFRYMKPYIFLAIISPLMMIGEVVADLILPYLMSFIVNYGITGMDINDSEKGSEIAAAIMKLFHGNDYGNMDIIITFGILMLAVTLVGGFFGVFCAYTAARAAQGFGNDLRRDAFKKVMSLSIEQTDKFTTGSLVTRMTNDISMITEFMEMLMRMFVRSPMFLIGGTIMLVTLDLQFGAILLCAIPVLIVIIIFVLAKAMPLYGVVQKKLDKVNSVVQENVSGARVVKACVKEDYEYNRFENANGELKNTNYSVLKLMAVITPVLTVIQNFAVIAIIYIGGINISIEKNGMDTGTIMAAITYISQVIMSVMMTTNMFQSISRATASGKRIHEVIDTEPVITDGDMKYEGDAKSAKKPDTDFMVEMKNVSFKYPDTVGRPVLKDINLSIKKGETFAVIGATGCGKTSLVSLIPRFYDATDGEVYVDGINVKEYKLSALRSRIGYVMQKSELFSDTIEGNIRWGKPEASDEEIKEAAQAAQASSFIDEFSDGYNTFIAEKGASLSGGQKQRMSIARALLRKPDILILDDSTSALDLVTEARLRASFKKLPEKTTVIMIAQRIASVMEADRIAVIESDGSIVSVGTHEELMQNSDTYRDIYASQNKSNADDGKGGVS